jgi:hypothetical protein
VSSLEERSASTRVKERGHWQLTLALRGQGGKAVERGLSDLLPIVQRAEVSKRGWSLPAIQRDGIKPADPYIEGGSSWARYHERWRLYRDGDFLLEQGLRDDWNEYHFTPAENRPHQLNLIDAVYTLTEIYTFAARLGSAWGDIVTVRMIVRLEGVAGRELWMNDQRRAWHGGYVNNAPSLNIVDDTFELLVLTQQADPLACAAATRLFDAFTWKPAPGIVESIQSSLGQL